MFDSISYLVYEDKVNVWGLLLYFTCECEDIPYDSLRKAESVLGLNHEKAHRDFNMAVTGSDNGIDWIDDNFEIYFQQSICRLSYLPKDALVDIYCVVTYYISETHNITHTINIANEKLYFIATKFNIDRIWFAQEAATRIGRYHGFIQEEETPPTSPRTGR